MRDLYNLLRGQNIKPYFFGLGFIQCKVSDSQRYHFYHPSLLPTVDYEEEAHDHRYDFHSKIIKGSLKNRIYNFKENNLGQYNLQNESCNPNIKIENHIKVFGDLTLISDKTYYENDIYFMDNNTFHTVESNLAITHLTRSEYKKVFANVIRKNNTEKVCPFEKKVSEKECWEFIAQCCEY